MAMRRGAFLIFYGNLKTIRLSAATFTAAAAQGTAIGTLSVVGGKGVYTFTLTNSAGGAVQLVGSALQVGATATPSPTSFTIGVQANNGASDIINQNFVITAVAAGNNTLLVQPGDDLLVDVGNPLLVQ